MNLTLSVDDKLVEKARQIASRQGTSLQALIRRYIETLAGSSEGEALVEQLQEHWREADKDLQRHPANRSRFNREDLYEDRIGRGRRGR
jgi:uncharacterized protein DUF6364